MDSPPAAQPAHMGTARASGPGHRTRRRQRASGRMPPCSFATCTLPRACRSSSARSRPSGASQG
eukprot:5794777-Pyramimonas_sp.AAC.1